MIYVFYAIVLVIAVIIGGYFALAAWVAKHPEVMDRARRQYEETHGDDYLCEACLTLRPFREIATLRSRIWDLQVRYCRDRITCRGIALDKINQHYLEKMREELSNSGLKINGLMIREREEENGKN